jgi:putative nucleotidyltransferase with HDIG domain
MKRVAIYVSAVTVAALCTLRWLYLIGGEQDAVLVRAAICFCVLGLFANALQHQLARGASGSVAFIPFLTAAILAPGWFTVVAVAASVALVEVFAKRAPLKGLFNVSQHALAIGLGIIAYCLLGGKSLLATDEAGVASYFALFFVFAAINSLAVSGAVALSEGRRIVEVWKENTLGTIGFDFLALPFVYVFARVYAHFGVSGATALAAFLVGARQLYAINWQLQKTNQELLELMVAAIEARDPYTSGHSRRVARLSTIIAQAIGLSRRQVERIRVAALLHDVGKIHEIFAPILSKPGKLTAEERAIIETHPIKSAELVQNVSQLRDVVAPVRHHHENWDGSGYPDGLAGEDIPLAARIIMFADTIDAMTSNRPYRTAMRRDEVSAELLRMRGKQFDPAICDALLASPSYPSLFSAVGAIQSPHSNLLVFDRKIRRIPVAG